ncbi:MAG: AAC(3) family N-acetyltransferase [Gammaproteobacteria bacterium]|nr:AAC(3) family N-acetyltransferase [Gammaproteobacteria bacterium]
MTQPNTTQSLTGDLSHLGLRQGMTVMVHSSLRKIGWTVGGPVAVVRALLDALGPEGTLVMPAESPYVSDPSDWDDQRVKAEWHDAIREYLPVFDPQTTPTTMGAIAESFRTYPGTSRSDHPMVSVCANGHLAQDITAQHSLAFCEGRGTPFEKLYDVDAQILLLGVGFNRCTSLHYAESLVPNRRTTVHRYPMMINGERRWVENEDMANDNGVHFPVVGEQFVASNSIRVATVGEADAMLVSTRQLVDFAESYFAREL